MPPSYPTGTSLPASLSRPASGSLPSGTSYPGGAGESAPVSPLSIYAPGAIEIWVRSDLGPDEAGGAGTGVSTWPDQGGNGNDYAQTNPALRPALQATGGPNGGPAISSAGTGWLLNQWNNPAPGTTPLFLWMIVKINAFVANGLITGGQAATRFSLKSGLTTPNTLFSNGVNSGNVAMVVGTWYRVCAALQNTAADYLRIGANATTGTALGNNATAGGWALFANNLGSAISNCTVAELLVSTNITKLGQMDTYGAALYPAVTF